MTSIPPEGGAEPPTDCLTFAVPMLGDVFGDQKEVAWQDRGPLVPWQVRGAEDLWVPIGGTGELVDRFRARGPAPRAIVNTQHQQGHLVVVSGGRGVGKTTFLHKIIHDLEKRLTTVIRGGPGTPAAPGPLWSERGNDERASVQIVPTAGPENEAVRMGWRDGDPPVRSLETVNRRILGRIREKVGPEIERMAGHRLDADDLHQAYEALSKALVSARRAVLILVPDYRWSDERLTKRFYRSCSDYATTGIVFFVESSSSLSGSDLANELRDPDGSHTIHLPLGPLCPGDWIRFIAKRHGETRIPGSHVRLADDILNGDPEPWMLRSVGELQRALYAVTQRAHENRKAEIDVTTLSDYYNRSHLRVDVDQFRRDGGTAGGPWR